MAPLLGKAVAVVVALSGCGTLCEGNQLLRHHRHHRLPGDRDTGNEEVAGPAPAPAPAAAPKEDEADRAPKQKKEEEPDSFDKPRRHDPHFVRAMVFKHQLRVCNAYPSEEPVDVYNGKKEKLTVDAPLPYKECRDFRSPLKAGDRIHFELAGASAGSFSISDLPNNDAVLLLVIHRHDKESSAVAFESHVFASLQNAQVAIIDTYRGTHRSITRLAAGGGNAAEQEQAEEQTEEKKADKEKEKEKEEISNSEELRYNSVIAVNPGLYEVLLADKKGNLETKTPLVALKHESYVVMRMGVESDDGPQSGFPEDVVVFPKSDAALLGGAWSSLRQISWVPFFSALVALVMAAV